MIKELASLIRSPVPSAPGVPDDFIIQRVLGVSALRTAEAGEDYQERHRGWRRIWRVRRETRLETWRRFQKAHWEARRARLEDDGRFMARDTDERMRGRVWRRIDA